MKVCPLLVDESYLDALLNSSTSSHEDFVVEQSTCNGEKCEDDNEKCENDHQKCDDDHEKLFRELYENCKSRSELLSDETLESDDLVSEDGDCGMEEKKFKIWYEPLPCDVSRFENR
ncbi:hypothetical protein Tco_1189977, partial [Tanacetum coccineum]